MQAPFPADVVQVPFGHDHEFVAALDFQRLDELFYVRPRSTQLRQLRVELYNHPSPNCGQHPPGTSESMAKGKQGSKSEAVRQYLKANPKAGPKEVVDSLKATGITVTAGLVSSIKYGGKGPRKRKPAVAKKRRLGNLSDAIRGYLSQHPEAKPKEIRIALSKEGVKVATGLISNVKHTFQKKVVAPKVRVAARSASASSVTVEQLLEVRHLAQALGGVENVRKALDTLEQLQ